MQGSRRSLVPSVNIVAHNDLNIHDYNTLGLRNIGFKLEVNRTRDEIAQACYTYMEAYERCLE